VQADTEAIAMAHVVFPPEGAPQKVGKNFIFLLQYLLE
jgi:hypothetical protein